MTQMAIAWTTTIYHHAFSYARWETLGLSEIQKNHLELIYFYDDSESNKIHIQQKNIDAHAKLLALVANQRWENMENTLPGWSNHNNLICYLMAFISLCDMN